MKAIRIGYLLAYIMLTVQCRPSVEQKSLATARTPFDVYLELFRSKNLPLTIDPKHVLDNPALLTDEHMSRWFPKDMGMFYVNDQKTFGFYKIDLINNLMGVIVGQKIENKSLFWLIVYNEVGEIKGNKLLAYFFDGEFGQNELSSQIKKASIHFYEYSKFAQKGYDNPLQFKCSIDSVGQITKDQINFPVNYLSTYVKVEEMNQQWVNFMECDWGEENMDLTFSNGDLHLLHSTIANEDEYTLRVEKISDATLIAFDKESKDGPLVFNFSNTQEGLLNIEGLNLDGDYKIKSPSIKQVFEIPCSANFNYSATEYAAIYKDRFQKLTSDIGYNLNMAKNDHLYIISNNDYPKGEMIIGFTESLESTERILILSDRFQTTSGFGVGSSIKDIVASYSDAQLIVDDNGVLKMGSTELGNETFFILEFYTDPAANYNMDINEWGYDTKVIAIEIVPFIFG